MFCSNCGNRVPDGANFCSACGARLAVAADTLAVEPVEMPLVEERSQDFSFDWSGVKDEPHKKEVREVASPWGSSAMNTETVVEEEQRSRTMSFIDILKKEREEKARAAEEEPVVVVEEEQPAPKHAAHSEMPSFYEPPMYEDLNGHTVTPFDNMKDEEPEESTIVLDGSEFVSDRDEEDSSKARLTAELAAILDAGSGNPAGEEDDSVDLFEDTEEIDFPSQNVEEEYVAEETTPETTPVYEEPVFEPSVKDETTGAFDYEALIAELNDIAGTEPTETLLADYIEESEEFAEQVEATEETVEETVEEEPVYEEPVVEEEYVPSHGATAFSFEEESPVEVKDAEIDALKKRLAELMGDTIDEESVEEPVYEEPVVESVYEEPAYEAPVYEEEPVAESTVEVEEDKPFFEAIGISTPAEEPSVEEEEPEVVEAPETEEVVEEVVEEPVVEEELPLIDPTPDAEDVLPLINEEHEEAVIAEEKEESVEDETTDAMSVEELEKDLFGEVPEDDAEAEATKKIDKFYTLYKKNEEFQKLLDEEYNKLKMEEEVVPTVSAILEEAENTASEASEGVEEVAETATEVAAPVEEVVEKTEEVVEEVSSAVETVAKEDVASDEETSGKGGTALTVIAVIVAVLLVILLAIILVLNFAPDSAIALKLDSVIETITSYFSAVDVPGNFLL
ncbi:MAG: zinc-ribbon domain-containing protein [Clostridiales bacterium]|nr:zinc-ribbon domain-containing protein [Candidatus Crickella equi]